MDLASLDANELATLHNLVTRGLNSLPKTQRAATRAVADKVYAGIDDAIATHRQRMIEEMRNDALDESVRRLKDSGADRHDDGLILALLASGDSIWTAAARLGLSDQYVRNVRNRAYAAGVR